MGDMPEHFRFKLSCTVCGGSLDADGHNSMSCLDAYLSEHIAAFGHNQYTLAIRLDSWPPPISAEQGNPNQKRRRLKWLKRQEKRL